MNWKPIAAAVVLVLAIGAADADALSWPWKRKGSGKKKLPTAIDSPIVRVKTPEHHKPGNRARHRTKYDRPEWGAKWEQTLNVKGRQRAHPWVMEGVR